MPSHFCKLHIIKDTRLSIIPPNPKIKSPINIKEVLDFCLLSNPVLTLRNEKEILGLRRAGIY